MSHSWHRIVEYVNQMGPHEWFLVLGAMIIVAAVCMRGFGSRSQY